MSKIVLLPPNHPYLFDPQEIEADLRPKVLKKDQEVNERMSEAGKAFLRLGKALFEMQELFKDKRERTFVRWLRSKMPPRTGYRLIGMYKHLREFSPVIAERAAAADIPMGGVTERSPFGKYTDLVKHMPPPPQELDEVEEADQWLATLRAKLLEAPNKRQSHNPVVIAAEWLARTYMRDSKAGDFEAWLKKVSLRAEELIDKRQKSA